MLALTKQEQRFILLLLFAFVVGLGVKVVRNYTTEADETWNVQKEEIYQEFQARSHIQQAEYASNNQQRSITKAALIGKININTANSDELQLLPRVGPAIAARIVDYRKENGPFKTIAEIQNVKNIGPKTFDKIKDYIKTE